MSGLRRLIRKAAPVVKKALPILIALAAAALVALGEYNKEQWPL